MTAKTNTTTTTAKGKTSVAIRQRNNAAKLQKRAATAAAKMSLEQAIDAAIAGCRAGESACAVLAEALEREFGADWYRWSGANMRTDNERAALARLEEARRTVQHKALERGLANPNKPWSDARRYQRRKAEGGFRPDNRKPWEEKARQELIRLYRQGMRHESLPDEVYDLVYALGLLLRDRFKIDLSRLNA